MTPFTCEKPRRGSTGSYQLPPDKASAWTLLKGLLRVYPRITGGYHTQRPERPNVAPHRDVSPDDCPHCRAIWSALDEHQWADPQTWLTTETIAQTVGLKKRATQDHLAHLFRHSRIDADRRTPLTGTIGHPLRAGAQQWAADVVAPDATCSTCLVALAGHGWEGQVGIPEWARAARTSARTVQRHRRHLIDADLVAFRPVTIYTGGRAHGRQADRYTLMSGLPAARLAGPAWDEAPQRAAAVLHRVRWFVDVTPGEHDSALRSITWCLRNGWPEDALLRALDATIDHHAYRPGGYLATLLRKLPTRYIIPARQIATNRTAPRITECPTCQTPIRTTLPGHVLCGGAICLQADTPSGPGASVTSIA